MEKTSTSNIETSVQHKLRLLINYAMQERKCFACWSMPKENTIHCLITDKCEALPEDYRLEHLKTGFLIAPFDSTKNKVFYLTEGLYWNTGKSFPANIPESADLQGTIFTFGKGEGHNTASEHYIGIVKKGINKIEKGELEKVVPARKKATALPENFDSLDFFMNFTVQYPDAFTSWYAIPEIGSWFGASPEILIEVKNNVFTTVALAGTQPFESTTSIKDTTWTQKEIEEQALVSRYIINCFKKIRLREFEEYGPKTIRAGNLLHLKTEYHVDMAATNFPDLGTTMLKLLHPTSAICGMPLESAKEFLLENEDFDRGYFSGYLGPVNMNSNTSLFVNLRCMQILEKEAVAYAGAGVTIDSDPARELNETEIKMNTLIRLFK